MKLCPVCTTQNQDAAATCENPDCQYGFDSSMNSQKTELFEKQQVFFSDGSFIAERYEIIKELGRGGMGVVYLVKDSKLRGREVALKMTHPELISHDEARQRFIDEVLLCLDLHHPNIVIVYPLEEWNNSLFFTMEYIPGQSLRALMAEKIQTNIVFTLEEAIQVVNPILDALVYAHKTTIHRDIKPENIMIQGDFPDIQVKVLDFGIAKVLSASRFTRTAQSMGTAYYMSPEQMKGAKHIDHRSDLYSVGMILYEMLTGEIAAGLFSLPSQLVKDLPKQTDELFTKTLNPKPEGRYKTAGQMKTALSQVPLTKIGNTASQIDPVRVIQTQNQELTKPAVTPKTEPTPDSAIKKKRFPVLLLLVVVIAGIVGFIGYPHFLNRPDKISSTGIMVQKETIPVLTINITPAQSDVYVDGALAGTAPLEIMDLPSGTHKIRVSKKRYKEYTEDIFIHKDQPKIIAATLIPLPFGDLKVDSIPEGATVFIDGTQKGTTPFFMENIKDGEHTIKLEKADYDPATSLITIEPLKAAALTKNLVYSYGSLQVNTLPDKAFIFLDNIKQGITPINIKKIKKGHHTLVLSLKGFKSATKKVIIESEQTQTLNISLEKITSQLIVEKFPATADVKILNIKEKYYNGIALDPGRYEIEVSAPGYVTQKQWVSLAEDKETVIQVKLKEESKTFTNSLGMTFVWIKPGTFIMGSPISELMREEGEDQHPVTLTRGYYMMTTEVTQGQWKAVMGYNPSYFKGDSLPVETMSWDDVQMFIKKMNQKDDKATYRLPTEAEWEYAARAGTTTAFAFGDCLSIEQANYNGGFPIAGCDNGQFRKNTISVGTLAPNSWGLYDMHGNVYEICQDWYGKYPSGPVIDPQGPSSGTYRVGRGGCWYVGANNCRSGNRASRKPDYSSSYVGFRLAGH
ncbi:MAG: PEGA domain-containing protein [Pseudomonadota bacterium]